MPDLLLCISRHQDSPQTPIKELTGLLPLEYLLKMIKVQLKLYFVPILGIYTKVLKDPLNEPIV